MVIHHASAGAGKISPARVLLCVIRFARAHSMLFGLIEIYSGWLVLRALIFGFTQSLAVVFGGRELIERIAFRRIFASF